MRLMLVGGDEPVLINLEHVRTVEMIGGACRLTFIDRSVITISDSTAETLFARLAAEAELVDGTTVEAIANRDKGKVRPIRTKPNENESQE